MTQDKNTDLTPEEQAEIAATMPALLESITKGSPAAPGWLAHWRGQRGISEEAKVQAEEFRQEVAAAPPEQGYLAQWCGFPTDMTRCSPFFPLNSSELGERRFLRNYLITSANWGEIHYTGPQLSTYEEDALLALLALLDAQSCHREQCFVLDEYDKETLKPLTNVVKSLSEVPDFMHSAFQKSLSYRGPALPLLRVLYGTRTPSKKDYIRLVSTLELMTVAGVKLSISTGKTKSGKRRSPHITQMSAMLAGVHWDDKKKVLTATINPFFYETYMAGRVTLMDVTKRMQLKGVITKALYRFVQSQRQNPVFTGHFLTLADALNMDREQPGKETRRQLKMAISVLIRNGVLTKKSGFVGQDIIKLDRALEALPTPEKKKTENY